MLSAPLHPSPCTVGSQVQTQVLYSSITVLQQASFPLSLYSTLAQLRKIFTSSRTVDKITQHFSAVLNILTVSQCYLSTLYSASRQWFALCNSYHFGIFFCTLLIPRDTPANNQNSQFFLPLRSCRRRDLRIFCPHARCIDDILLSL